MISATKKIGPRQRVRNLATWAFSIGSNAGGCVGCATGARNVGSDVIAKTVERPREGTTAQDSSAVLRTSTGSGTSNAASGGRNRYFDHIRETTFALLFDSCRCVSIRLSQLDEPILENRATYQAFIAFRIRTIGIETV